ncbi:MAG: penicillin acylase family protein [Natrialbaceae archaeon]|nr:penicillin acylase family protein [Natrialbaceae archaeon]
MVPPLLYEQHVLTPEANVRGFSFPGIPFAVFGANEYGAWGFTSESPDVLDLYSYEFDESGDRYRYKGEWREIERETRELEVAGGETRTISIEKTVHGSLLERNGQRVGVAWTGFGGSRSVRAMYDITRSESVDDILEALEFMDIPSAAFVYADRDEPIFYQTGKVPIRRTPEGEIVSGDRVFDGSTPEAEWPGYEAFGETDWDGPGFVPVDEMPHVRDPSILATANQGVVEEPLYPLGLSSGIPDRAKRIWDTLEAAAEAGETMDLEFHEAIMTDAQDERAAIAVPAIVGAIDERGRDDLADVRADLSSWDYRMVPESSAALVFDRWMNYYPRLAVEDVYEAAGLEPSAPSGWVAINLPAR